MDWRTFLILSKTRDYERLQIDRRREDYKRTKERILKYSLQNQVNYRMFSQKNGYFLSKHDVLLDEGLLKAYYF